MEYPVPILEWDDNIIGFKSKDAYRFMINPKIIKASEKMISTKSNCGSIKYREKITVKRHASIEVRYYDLEGNHWDETFTGKNGGFTIQHEIDHNNGIMITDRYLEQGGDPKLLEKI